MDKYIGVQYFTIRDFCDTVENFDSSCRKIADMGIKIVQISGTPLKAVDMRPILDKYDLKCVTTHRGFDDFVSNLDEVIEYNKILGCELCGIGMMPLDCAKSTESLTEFIQKINKICKKLKAANMLFGYHNHAFEFARLDSKLIMDRLIEETDSEVFNFIVDTYWIQVGGKNPAKFIEKLGKRAMAVHLKDCTVYTDKWSESSMCEVGSGNLDWDEIFVACTNAGSRWALIEQDINWTSNDPFASLESSYSFLKAKGFC